MKTSRLTQATMALAVLWLVTTARAEDKPRLPADIATIPSDSALLLSIRVGDLWDSEDAQAVRKQRPKVVEEVNREFRKMVGVGLDEIERITFTTPDIGPSEPFLIVTTRKAVDPKTILKEILPQGKEEKRKEKILYTQKGKERFGRAQADAVHFHNDRVYVIGTRQDIELWLDGEPDDKGPLQRARLATADKHQLVFALNIEKLNKAIGEMLPPEGDPFKPLLAGRLGLVTASLDGQAGARGDAVIVFPGEKEATAGLKGADALLAEMRKELGQGLKELAKQSTSKPFLKLLEQFDQALGKAAFKQDGSVVKGSLVLRSDPQTWLGGLIDGFTEMRAAAARMEVSNNLKQLGLAFHNYESVHASLPPAAIYNKEGQALLSWRVLILPYVGENKLYSEFKLDEPWDSEHNKKLLSRMPAVYTMPGADKQNKSFETFYQVFTGKGTIFEGARSKSLPKIGDGTSNTFLVVESARAVPWTKPEDLPYDARKPLPKLGFSRPDYFLVAYADGSVRSHKTAIKEDKLRLLITPDDGQPIPSDD